MGNRMQHYDDKAKASIVLVNGFGHHSSEWLLA
jgi:hypothetical protein